MKSSKHIVIDDEDDDVEDKVGRLLEMFPQLTKNDAVEVSE